MSSTAHQASGKSRQAMPDEVRREPSRARGRALCLVQGLAYLTAASTSRRMPKAVRPSDKASRGLRKPSSARRPAEPRTRRARPRNTKPMGSVFLTALDSSGSSKLMAS